MSAGPRISVIVPNLDAPHVERTIDAIVAQRDARADEIIVAGRDGPGRLRGDERVMLVESGGPRPPGAMRNLGVTRATGDLLVFVDADCVPEPSWLAAHVARHGSGEHVVGGSVLWDEDNYWTLSDNLSMFHAFSADRPAGPRPFLPTLNLSVSREAWDAVGGMDPVLRCGEDLDFTIRLAALGYRSYFAPEARLWHRPPRSSMRAMLEHAHRIRTLDGALAPRLARNLPGTALALRAHGLEAALSPAIAAAATLRLFRRGAPGRRRLATLPAVYATKMAWCFGGARPIDLASRRAAAEADLG